MLYRVRQDILWALVGTGASLVFEALFPRLKERRNRGTSAWLAPLWRRVAVAVAVGVAGRLFAERSLTKSQPSEWGDVSPEARTIFEREVEKVTSTAHAEHAPLIGRPRWFSLFPPHHEHEETATTGSGTAYELTRTTSWERDPGGNVAVVVELWVLGPDGTYEGGLTERVRIPRAREARA